MANNPCLIQIRITKRRELLWEVWKRESRHEIGSRMIEEALKYAIMFKEIQRKAVPFMQIDPSLLADETVQGLGKLPGTIK